MAGSQCALRCGCAACCLDQGRLSARVGWTSALNQEKKRTLRIFLTALGKTRFGDDVELGVERKPCVRVCLLLISKGVGTQNWMDGHGCPWRQDCHGNALETSISMTSNHLSGVLATHLAQLIFLLKTYYSDMFLEGSNPVSGTYFFCPDNNPKWNYTFKSYIAMVYIRRSLL